MNRIAALVLAAVLLTPGLAFAKWARVSSSHFTFIGDVSGSDIREIALRLEQFRAVVGRVFSEDATISAAPTFVIIFRDDRSFSPFKPAFQGRPIASSGYFVGAEDANYIAVNADRLSDAYSVVFHEYAHAITANAAGAVPAWVSEGLAELYQTFESRNDGKSATIGIPPKDDLQILAAAPSLMSVAELMAVTHDSPMYNEGERRTLFYAESWALVHYLTFGSPARRGQLKTYLDAITEGTPPLDAFRRAFGSDTASLDRELQRYVTARNFQALRFDFNDKIADGAASFGVLIPDEEAAGFLGDMLARVGRTDDARGYLRSTIDAHPTAARAVAALGLLELRATDTDAAFPLLERAATLAPGTAWIQAAYGRALTRRADRGGADEDELYVLARTVLTRALELEPDNISTMVTLAEVEMGSGANPAKAVALMEQAVHNAPGRDEYRLMLAQALAVNGDYRAASASLEGLIRRSSRADVRDEARQALERISTAQAKARELADAFAADDVPAADAPRELSTQGTVEPILRPVMSGETRVFGTFAAVECAARATVLRIETANGPVQMAVEHLADVEFLAYRDDAPTQVACGAQTPAFHVLATFRTDGDPLPGIATPNRVIAIELLPDGFVPR